MTKRPWLSVLMPTYNGSSHLKTALRSILAQGDKNIECVVVDDGSTDDTISLLSEFQRELAIKVFQLKRRGNWVANTNFALSHAEGEYACFLHQDDLWLQGRLQVLKPLIESNPDVAFVLHPSSYITGPGKAIGIWRCPLPEFPQVTEPSMFLEKLLIQNFISIPAPIFKREVALAVGGLDEKLWYTADWDFWLKLSAQGKSVYYPKPLSGFRIHQSSQTVRRSISISDFKEQLTRVLDRHLLLWDNSEIKKQEVEEIARFSIKVNVFLASAYHRKGGQVIPLISQLFLLGANKGYRYFRDSRILERTYARLRAQVEGNF